MPVKAKVPRSRRATASKIEVDWSRGIQLVPKVVIQYLHAERISLRGSVAQFGNDQISTERGWAHQLRPRLRHLFAILLTTGRIDAPNVGVAVPRPTELSRFVRSRAGLRVPGIAVDRALGSAIIAEIGVIADSRLWANRWCVHRRLNTRAPPCPRPVSS